MLLAALLALAAAGEPPCDQDYSVPADVRRMARNPEAWIGRCVRLRGYVVGTMFYADAEGAYAGAAYVDGGDRNRRNDGWLGLYLRGDRSPALRRGTVTGRVHDCQRDYASLWVWAEMDSGVVDIGMNGYCALRSGLNLSGAHFRDEGPAWFRRPMGAAARARFGDLDPQGPGVEPPAEVVALADRFLAALRAGDGAAMEPFVEVWSGDAPDTPSERAAFRAYAAGEGDSPLRPLRLAAAAPQRAYFSRRRPGADGADENPWHVCFCRTADCAGRWPIHSADATAGRSRPYICLKAYHGNWSSNGPPDRLGIPMEETFFAEPNRSTR